MHDRFVGGIDDTGAVTPGFAPFRMSALSTVTFSVYVPGQTLTVSPAAAAFTPAWIVVLAGVATLQLVSDANPSSSTACVTAARAGGGPDHHETGGERQRKAVLRQPPGAARITLAA